MVLFILDFFFKSLSEFLIFDGLANAFQEVHNFFQVYIFTHFLEKGLHSYSMKNVEVILLFLFQVFLLLRYEVTDNEGVNLFDRSKSSILEEGQLGLGEANVLRGPNVLRWRPPRY